MRMMCDFCGGGPVTMIHETLPVKFDAGEFSTTRTFWNACEVCHQFAERGSPESMIVRMQVTLQLIYPTEPGKAASALRRMVPGVHDFFANRLRSFPLRTCDSALGGHA